MSTYTLDDTAGRLRDGQLLDRARPGKADPLHQGRAADPAGHPPVGQPLDPAGLDEGQRRQHEERRADPDGLRAVPGPVRRGVREGRAEDRGGPPAERAGLRQREVDPGAVHQLLQDVPGAALRAAERAGRDLVRNDVRAGRRHDRDHAGRGHRGDEVRQGVRPAVESADHRRGSRVEGPGLADRAQVRQLQLRDALLGPEPLQRRTCPRTITRTAKKAGS